MFSYITSLIRNSDIPIGYGLDRLVGIVVYHDLDLTKIFGSSYHKNQWNFRTFVIPAGFIQIYGILCIVLRLKPKHSEDFLLEFK